MSVSLELVPASSPGPTSRQVLRWSYCTAFLPVVQENLVHLRGFEPLSLSVRSRVSYPVERQVEIVGPGQVNRTPLVLFPKQVPDADRLDPDILVPPMGIQPITTLLFRQAL